MPGGRLLDGQFRRSQRLRGRFDRPDGPPPQVVESDARRGKSPVYRKLAWKQLPKIIDHYEPIGPLADHLALEAGLKAKHRPLVFPTSDDQQAGLVGGGAVDDGQMAIVLGNSAVVNSSQAFPDRDQLDVMPAQLGPVPLDALLQQRAPIPRRGCRRPPRLGRLGTRARQLPRHRRHGRHAVPKPEPSLGINAGAAQLQWFQAEGASAGKRYRASLEALAYLIALGVRAHEAAGQKITRITVSGGIARSDLMCEILATVLGHRRASGVGRRPGPRRGGTGTAAMESHLRNKRVANKNKNKNKNKKPFTVADAVATMVRFRKPIDPNPAWSDAYRQGLATFEQRLAMLQKQPLA